MFTARPIEVISWERLAIYMSARMDNEHKIAVIAYSYRDFRSYINEYYRENPEQQRKRMHGRFIYISRIEKARGWIAKEIIWHPTWVYLPSDTVEALEYWEKRCQYHLEMEKENYDTDHDQKL